MVVFKFTPTKEPIVNGESLYEVRYSMDRSNYEPLGLKVRAKTAAHAEQKVLFCFRRELNGKTLDFDLEKFVKENENGEGSVKSTD